MTTTDGPETVLASLSAPRSAKRTRIAHIADPHVSREAEGTPMVYHRSGARLRRALSDAAERGVDAVAFAGDLTKDGAPAEYEYFDDIVADVELPWFAVPGNHDVPKAPVEEYEYGDDHDTPPVERFEREYSPGGELPFVERVGGVEVVGLNTASMPDGSLRESHDGAVSDRQVEWLESTLPDLDTPVVLMHHNTPAMFDQLRRFRDRNRPEMGLPPVFREPEALVGALREHGVGLALTGHLHNPGIATTGSLHEIAGPASGSFPQAYLLIDIGPSGTTVRYVPLAGEDGMSEAHTARATDGETSAAYAGFGAIQLARMPLVTER
jgi:DNA repair exonuclease SbcCD nuclease subunit